MIINPANGVPPASNKIGLCTRKGSNIENSQLLDFTQDVFFRKQLNDLKEKFVGITERPKTVSPIYNCHGMTFANRRTGIEVNSELVKILKEDDYDEIKNNMDLLAGDIVLYYSDTGDIQHSGMIISPPIEGLSNTIKVLSKWGSGYEVIHGIYVCPYELHTIKFYRCIN